MIEEIGDSVRYLHAAQDIFRSAREPFAVHLTSMAICEAERLLQREYEKWSNRDPETAQALQVTSRAPRGRRATGSLASNGA